jgi:hypothetical protein
MKSLLHLRLCSHIYISGMKWQVSASEWTKDGIVHHLFNVPNNGATTLRINLSDISYPNLIMSYLLWRLK